MEEMQYVFSFTFFHCRSLTPCIGGRQVFLILSPPLQNFHVVLATKRCLLCFLSLALDLCHPFSVEFRCLATFSLFLCLSHAIYPKFVDMTINLSFILWKTRIQKQFPLSGFVFIDLLTLQLPLFYTTLVAMRFPAKITSSCIWVAIPVD